MPRRQLSLNVISTPQTNPLARASGARRVNINTATTAELEELPGVGPALAARVVEHRARYGPFRRVEHLIIVRGISERRFRALRPYVSTE